MSRAAKTIEAMRANPQGWRIEDLETVAAAFGVPAKRPINPVYVRQFVALIDTVRGNHERD